MKKIYQLSSLLLICFYLILNCFVITDIVFCRSENAVVTSEEAIYNRQAAINTALLYYEKTENDNDQNIDGKRVYGDGIDQDCAHFVSCCIGNPYQRYPKINDASELLCGGLSLGDYNNSVSYQYGIHSSWNLHKYLTKKTIPSQQELVLGEELETVFQQNESDFTQKNIEEYVTANLMDADFIHITYNYMVKGEEISGGHSLLYDYDEVNKKPKVFSHNNYYYMGLWDCLKAFTGYKIKGSLLYNVTAYFVHIYEYDELFNSDVKAKFKLNQTAINNKNELRLRTGPGSDYKVVKEVDISKSNAFKGTIISKPRSLDGRIWYLVEYYENDKISKNMAWAREACLELSKETGGGDNKTTLKTPKLKKPEDDAKYNSGQDITFQWEKVDGNEIKYTLQINGLSESNSGFQFIKANYSQTSFTFKTKNNPIPTGSYSWKVQAKDSSGNQSEWSTERHFTVNKGEGTINVYAEYENTYIDGVHYEISGPSYSKSGETTNSITKLTNCPEGEYAVTWLCTLDGYEMEATNLVGTLTAGSSITFSVKLKKEQVNEKVTFISVKAKFRGEDWTGSASCVLMGPDETITYNRLPCSFSNKQIGQWTLSLSKGGGPRKLIDGSWRNASYDIQPSSSQKSTLENKTIEFTIYFYFEDELPQDQGTIIVKSNISQGEFILSGPNNFQVRSKTPYTNNNADVGQWSINWISVNNYNTPSNSSGTLNKDATLTFNGNYTSKGGGETPPPGGGDGDKITLTLYVHEGSTEGIILEGVTVTGSDGKGNYFNEKTNSYGYVKISGYKSGNKWQFSAYKSGYKKK